MQPEKPRKTTRRHPPDGYITAAEATALLGNRMLYKYTEKGLIEKIKPEGSKHGFYKQSNVLSIRNTQNAFYERGIVIGRKNETMFSRATIDDMDGVYQVAIELFPHGTTSAEARKPLVAKCPDGNYVVKEQNEIVAYIHLQPLKQEPLRKFMSGKIRGRDITADDLDCFEPGKTVDVLVKSMGATYQYGEEKHHHYIQRLLFGTANALTELGKHGVIIRKIYATSETETGIALSLHARMKTIRRLSVPKPKEHELTRYAFELDVDNSDLPLLRPYKRALAEWQKSHPQD